MTYPLREEVNISTNNRLLRLLDVAWMEADKAREQCLPGSKQEADYLAQQLAIEELQKVLTCRS